MRTRLPRSVGRLASWAAKDGSVNDHAGHRSFSSKAFLDTAPGLSRAGYISARIQIATDRPAQSSNGCAGSAGGGMTVAASCGRHLHAAEAMGVFRS